MGRADRRVRATGGDDRWLSARAPWPWGRTRRPAAAAPRSRRRSARRWSRSAASGPEIVGLTADLGKYTDILPFRDAFPDRFFNVGMAEQNLIAVAAGLARTGKIAVRHDLRRVRHAPRLRLHRHRRRAQPAQREDHRRPARPHHRLRRHAPGDRGSGADADDPRPRRHRPVRRHRDRPGDRGDRRLSTARSTCGCCAARCRSCSTRRPTASRSARRDGCATGSDVGIIATGLMTERALDAASDARRTGHRRRRAARADAEALRCAMPSRSSPARSTAIVTAENHVVVGGLASLVVEALFERGIAKPAHAASASPTATSSAARCPTSRRSTA